MIVYASGDYGPAVIEVGPVGAACAILVFCAFVVWGAFQGGRS